MSRARPQCSRSHHSRGEHRRPVAVHGTRFRTAPQGARCDPRPTRFLAHTPRSTPTMPFRGPRRRECRRAWDSSGSSSHGAQLVRCVKTETAQTRSKASSPSRRPELRIIDVQANGLRIVLAQPANARLMNVAAGELCAILGVGEKPAGSRPEPQPKSRTVFPDQFQWGANSAKTNAWTSRPISSNRWRRASTSTKRLGLTPVRTMRSSGGSGPTPCTRVSPSAHAARPLHRATRGDQLAGCVHSLST